MCKEIFGFSGTRHSAAFHHIASRLRKSIASLRGLPMFEIRLVRALAQHVAYASLSSSGPTEAITT